MAPLRGPAFRPHPMSAARHVMILASAGSGKTYALTNRFVELLAAGAAPERIVALTFTRKAAGEFFDEILRKLARAARDERYARELAGAIAAAAFARTATDERALGTADFRRLLRAMIDAMPRLRLGTLDSFFARVARAFPLELGLAGEFEILQEHAARLERRRVLRTMFARSGAALDPAQGDFIEAFKRATFGSEEKQLGARLDALLDRYQENYLAAPDPALWCDPARIWPAGSPWLAAPGRLADGVRELRGTLGEMSEGQRARWEAFFTALGEWTPGAPLSPPVEYVLKNALAVWPDLRGGTAVITIDRRKLALPPGACRALERIVTHVVGAELRRRIEMTRGIFAVLRGYDLKYHDAVRRAGRLTFADVQRMLAPVTLARSGSGKGEGQGEGEVSSDQPQAAGGGPGAGGAVPDEPGPSEPLSTPGPEEPAPHPPPVLVTQAGDAERRLLLDYRLDAEIDHWLLDEFQDTSFGQWSVLRNLIDEVVQDPEGRRSFFCVGDVKQAIYTWREGDPRLLREIFNHYNAAAPGAIAERHLVESRRSGPAPVAMVNAVFGDGPALARLFPGDATATWNREWREHRSAVAQRHGQAALLHAGDEEARWAATRRLIEEIRPLERGLSCAVLVRQNRTAAALAEHLRGAGIAAVAESDLRIATDNPLGAALLALVQAAAHPGDTLAQEHVRMTPLGAILLEDGSAAPEALTRRVLGQVHADGFERAMEYWIRRLESRLAPADAFSRLRAREFAVAAGVFDATGSRDPDEFLAFMGRYTVRAPESPLVVRVMTIHKAKGLGFDVVVVPDLEGSRIDERREGLAVQKAADRSVEWVLDLPPRLFCAPDEVLAAHVTAAEAEACYESLSLLYVALTRSKRALYVITAPVGESKSRNYPRLLAETLGRTGRDICIGGARFAGAWTSGDPDWHLAAPMVETGLAPIAPSRRLEPLSPDAARGSARHAARRASAAGGGTLPAGALFALEASTAAGFGTALHALLAEVEWAEPRDVARWEQTWRARDEPEAVVAAAAACLRAPALARVWRRPSDAAEVWRERAFEIVIEGTWVTGIFDRVCVEKVDGRAVAATVYDFKTDRIAPDGGMAAAVERHAAQLRLYGRVVAVLTGLRPEEVRCEVVFTSIGRAAGAGVQRGA